MACAACIKEETNENMSYQIYQWEYKQIGVFSWHVYMCLTLIHGKQKHSMRAYEREKATISAESTYIHTLTSI